jgi:phosphoribosylamine--glycine ligase
LKIKYKYMNIIVIGSGGREHTLAWKISQSPLCDNLFLVPGNAGTAGFAQNVDISASDFEKVGEFALEKQVDLVVVGPEAPLVDGIRDFFSADDALKNIGFIGPDKRGASIEGSKDFSKKFMIKYGIPTAGFKTFTVETLTEAKAYIRSQEPPIVLKADGLAAGKGVLICKTIEEAETSIDSMLRDKMFGKASEKVVIEDFLDGIEVSVFILADGKDYVLFPEAKDYKRIRENDQGPNTGGMGSVSPVNFADKTFMDKVEERIIKPTINGLRDEGIDYRGFIFLGLINIKEDPFVIEYNVRMGDPESQVVIPRIESDFVQLLSAAANGKLGDKKVEFSEDTAVTVVMASAGYPGSYEKGKEIKGIDSVDEAIVFQAGTKLNAEKQILTNGGRVLAVTGKGSDLQSAIDIAYANVSKISWDGAQYRKDIGQDLLKLDK